MILMCGSASCSSLKKVDKDTSTIIMDLHMLMDDSHFDDTYICVHLLNKLVQITESEFGFLTTMTDRHKLQGHTTTDFAWNEFTKHMFIKEFNSLELSYQHPVFKSVIDKQTACIIHDPPSFLPSGHPTIKQMLCVPIYDGEHMIGILSVCNKFEKYSNKDIQRASDILHSSTTQRIIKKYICNEK